MPGIVVRSVLLFVKNLVFTIVVPGTAAVYVPVFLFPHDPVTVSATSVVASFLLLFGAAVYLWCLWDFASYGRGTPAPIDPPRRLASAAFTDIRATPCIWGCRL